MTAATDLCVDLFCGAGGLTEGLELAARELKREVKVIAVNHWYLALETHCQNHPKAIQVYAELSAGDNKVERQARGRLFSVIENANPRGVLPGRKLRVLVGGPECTHHSNARGGKPRSEQRRSSAWCIPRWIEAREPRAVILENVPEFKDWGPLYRSGKKQGKPISSRKGQIFKVFVAAIEALGYTVEWRILNCADYGDATTRRRLFIFAARTTLLRRHGLRGIPWPEPTHAPREKAKALKMKPWKPAREVIDWTVCGHSIFMSKEDVRQAGLRIKRPLSPNTVRRIAVGISKYWGAWAEPFLVMLYGTNDVRGLGKPLPTVTGEGNHIGLAEPFLVSMNYMGSREHDGRYTREAGQPLPTITGQGNRFGLAQACLDPLVVPQSVEGRVRECGKPLPTILTRGAIALVEPLVVATGQTGGNGRRVRSVKDPLPTCVSKQEACLVEPFVLPQGKTSAPRKAGKPLPTLTTTSRGIAVVEPFVVPQFGERKGQTPRSRSVKEPVPAVTSHGAGAVVTGELTPLIVKYYGTGRAHPVTEPIDTATARARFALVEPGILDDLDSEDGTRYLLDIRFRMLQPHELASAHSFPKGYTFRGTKEQKVKQIGNSVPVKTSKALCGKALSI